MRNYNEVNLWSENKFDGAVKALREEINSTEFEGKIDEVIDNTMYLITNGKEVEVKLSLTSGGYSLKSCKEIYNDSDLTEIIAFETSVELKELTNKYIGFTIKADVDSIDVFGYVIVKVSIKKK